MQLTINLPQDIERALIRQATLSNVSIQVLVIEALRQQVQGQSGVALPWPEAILSYQGTPDFPAFESYRDDLLPLTEPELF